GPRPGCARLRHPGPARAWRRRPGASLRHRVARPHREPFPRRACAGRIALTSSRRKPRGIFAMQKTLIAIAAVISCGAAQAQTKWDMPTPYSDGEFHTRNARAFAEDVKKNTGGALDITVHANQSLIKHPDTLRAVQTGQVNIGEILLGQFSNED